MTAQRWIVVRPGLLAPQLKLRAGSLHVWSIPLDLPESVVPDCKSWLSSDERVRAERFIRPVDRRRYVVAHAALRFLLARYAGGDPQSLSLVAGPQGKPALANGGELGLAFNLSHSGELAAIAMSQRNNVGIDIECVRAVPEAATIAKAYFSPAEVSSLGAASPSEFDRDFLICWTRKEAFVKALGGGLSIPLDRFDVDIRLESPAILRVDDEHAPAHAWTMIHLDPSPRHVGAAVLDRPVDELCLYRLELGEHLGLP
jgi:4'-phosphopantetheinyl transferase